MRQTSLCLQGRFFVLFTYKMILSVESGPQGSPSYNVLYYILTEKYSPKSYVVIFRTQISSSQPEERTMVFTREKNDTSNRNRERCFSRVKKMIRPIRSHRGV